ncbi:MAG TPA: nitroreductase family protein [Ruminiclostridium sp.]|nr:nitroreductase family protein [Ruminiclostridium sp.]
MNETLEILKSRKSVRVYEDREIPANIKSAIIDAALRAPTAGNMMLYSVIEITEQSIKEKLAHTCDEQPFIAKAPLLLLFLADYQRWYDYFAYSKVSELCDTSGTKMRKPEEGDLMLACNDALIAAQTAVIAAEALGIGSCYIGDIMENCEVHREIFGLPDYTFPIALVCFGYPTKQQKERKQPDRFDRKYIVFENSYKRLINEDFDDMFSKKEHEKTGTADSQKNVQNYGQYMYLKKFSAEYSVEMSRSVREFLKHWKAE